MPYNLPDLPYQYDALKPVIGEEIMRLHHQKHHRSYVEKLNTALESLPEFANQSIVELLTHLDDLPDSVRQAVRNNGGGHYNHSLFWQVMSPGGGGDPTGDIGQRIMEKWGSFAAFRTEFNEKATKLFGSGWVWLTADMQIVSSPNQDNPLMSGGTEPIFGLDVWEHAYYLDYKNRRDKYIEKWWDVVDWGAIDIRYKNLI